MASTEKSSILGLNLWKETDRPKRSDFVADNNIIDSVLGAHANNSQVHLSAEERETLNNLNSVYQFSGSGDESRSVTLPFAPSFVFVFKKGEAPVVYSSDGYNVINFSYAASSGANGGGVTLSGAELCVTQSTAAANGAFYNLNKQYSQYTVLMLC